MLTQHPHHTLPAALDAIAQGGLTQLSAAFPLASPPALVWKNYRTTAGRAYYRENLIGLSRHVLKDEQAVRDTLAHEYAHLLAVHREGPKGAGHGEAWRRAMRDMGQEPRVTHCYEVKRNVPKQRVTYACAQCGAAIVRARRLPKGKRYFHARCGGPVRLKSVEPIADR